MILFRVAQLHTPSPHSYNQKQLMRPNRSQKCENIFTMWWEEMMRKEEKKQMVGDLLRRDQFAQSFNLPLSEALARDIGPADCQPPLHLRKTSKNLQNLYQKKSRINTENREKFVFLYVVKMYIIGRFSSPCHNSGCLVVWAVGLSPPPRPPPWKSGPQMQKTLKVHLWCIYMGNIDEFTTTVHVESGINIKSHLLDMFW